jgi:hypothetical protein
MKSITCDWRILFDFCMAEARAQSAVSEQRSLMARRERGASGGGIAKRAQGPVVKAHEQLTEAERGQAQQAAVEHAAREEADRKAAASKQRAASSERVKTAAFTKTDSCT